MPLYNFVILFGQAYSWGLSVLQTHISSFLWKEKKEIQKKKKKKKINQDVICSVVISTLRAKIRVIVESDK